jgi:flagellar biosynthesis/type III secretory pathway chaperone
MKKEANWIIFITLLSCLGGPVIYAQEPPSPVRGLNTYEEKLDYWQSLTEKERQALREREQNFSPQQLQALRKKQEWFNHLPYAEQERIMINYERYIQLSPENRAELERNYRRFRHLPKEVRMELRRKAIERRPQGFIRDEEMMRRLEEMKRIQEERRKSYEEMMRRRNSPVKMQVARPSRVPVKSQPGVRRIAPVMKPAPKTGGLNDNGPGGDPEK